MFKELAVIRLHDVINVLDTFKQDEKQSVQKLIEIDVLIDILINKIINHL